MTSRFWLAASMLAFVLMSTPAQSNAALAISDDLTALAKDMTFTWARLHPMTATELGIAGYDGQLDVPSLAAQRRDRTLNARWLRRLYTIAPHAQTLVDRDDAALLHAKLIRRVREDTVYRTNEKDYSAPAQAIVDVIFTQFQRVPAGSSSQGAWKDIIARMELAPRYIAEGQKLVRHPGHLFGVVGAQGLAGAPDFFTGALTDAAKAQLPAAKFQQFVVARDHLVAILQQTKAFIDQNASRWPENYVIGARAYNAMLHDEQMLPFNANDVVRMGEDELAHGWAEQAWLESLAASRKTTLGAQSGGGLAPSGPALIPFYRQRIAQLREFVTLHDIVTVPDWLGEVQVVETPKFLQPVQPGASMQSPRLFSQETSGFYFITPPKSFAEAASRLDLYEDFDHDRILSTAAHEAMPGHFMQLSIARRHPDFVRRIQDSGVFAEGWAYYGEEMFVRLGLYGENLDGALDVAQWERIRGARAIVDARLASGQWSYREAADFFARETGAQQGQADAAVAGIALGPGYVISYTVGRLQLENLLTEYRRRMGTRGSLHDFHDRLLSYGTTPYAVVRQELLADLNKSAAQVRAAANY
ncbi:MAG: DUF885 domain-containing protein [Candidatus Eremiobacteraeota bacterium]|nr:DUF885 domain-containing protein [Candidatus Eremiobacteraeota bacterium]